MRGRRPVAVRLRTGCGKPCGQSVEDRRCAVDHSRSSARRAGGGAGRPRHNGEVSGLDDQAAPQGDDEVRGPVAALRRIAFLLERSRAETYKVKAFRAAAETILPLGDEVEEPGAAGHPARAARHRRLHRRRDRGSRRGARARPAGQARARGRRPPGRRGYDGARGAAGRPALPQRLVRRRLPDRGDGVHRDRARSRLPRAHRPLAAPEGRQRALGRPAHPAARRGRGGQRAPRVGWFPAAQGDRGRHPRRRLAGPDRRDARAARRTRRLGALQARHGQGADDPADGGCGAEPVRQRAGPLHRSAGHRQPRQARAVGVRRRAGLRRVRGDRDRGRDQLPARASRPARRSCCSRRSTWAACSRSTATPTRPASWTSRSTAASGPRSWGSSPTGS